MEVFRVWDGRGQDRRKIVQKVWSALATLHIINIDLPPWIGKKNILVILYYVTYVTYLIFRRTNKEIHHYIHESRSSANHSVSYKR